MQLQKQSSCLAKYASNPTEFKLATAKDGLRIEDAPIELIIDVVGKWGFYLGTKKLAPEDIILLSKFLKEEFGLITIEEADLAIKLNIKGGLGDFVEFYGNLSPMYMSLVLSQFLIYRKEQLEAVWNRKFKAEVKTPPKPSPEEEMKTFISIYESEYSDWVEGGQVKDYFSIVYNHLKKTRRITPTEQDLVEAQEYANKKVTQDKYRGMEKIVHDSFHKDNELSLKLYAENYLVELYFQEHSVDFLINSLKPEEF